jgi:hypothetical protein
VAEMSRKCGAHFCWACGRMRLNERFSGRGRARHLCRDCSKLGPEELAYRQGGRALDRLVVWSGGVPRRHRKACESFLRHSNSRLRQYAAGVPAAGDQRSALPPHEPIVDDADLPLPLPSPEGAEWIEAYRQWIGEG